MSDPEQPPKMPVNAKRLAGMGMELAGTVTVACLLGIWIDHKFDTSPVWIVICSLLGIVGGLYNMLRQSVHGLFPNKGVSVKDDKDKGNLK